MRLVVLTQSVLAIAAQAFLAEGDILGREDVLADVAFTHLVPAPGALKKAANSESPFRIGCSTCEPS